jgi:hypothetical protein
MKDLSDIIIYLEEIDHYRTAETLREFQQQHDALKDLLREAAGVMERLHCERFNNIEGGEDGARECYYCDHDQGCTAQMFMEAFEGESVVESLAAIINKAKEATP